MSKIYLVSLMGVLLLDPSIGRAEAKPEASIEKVAPAPSPVRRSPACLVPARGGKHFLAGNSYSKEAGGSFWIWKVNEKGEAVWQKDFQSENQDEVLALIATDDGGVLAVGHLFAYRPKIGYRSWVKKLNKDGEAVYTKIIDGYARAEIILETDDGNYLLGGTGRQKEDKSTYDAWLMKMDPQGERVWEKSYDRGSDEAIHSGVQINKGEFLFLATRGTYNKFGQGPSEVWLFTCNSTGEIIKETQLPDGRIMSRSGQLIAGNEDQFAVVYTTTQLPSICSVDVTTTPSFGAQVVGFSDQLEQQWSKSIAGYSSILTPLIQPLPDGGYLVAGSVKEGPKMDKIGHGGNEIWTQIIPLKAEGFSIYDVRGLVVEKANAYIMGSVMRPMSGDYSSRVFLFKVETQTSNILWQKEY